MSKQYKGWEIAKMICEGKLKEGILLIKSDFSSEKTFKVVSHHLEFTDNECDESGHYELGSSFLATSEGTYEIIQQPVSFMEVVKSGKKCKVEHELIDTDLTVYSNKKISDFNDLDWVLFTLTVNQIDIKAIIQEGKWYIEESEAESNE